jgi:hypothetical protein
MFGETPDELARAGVCEEEKEKLNWKVARSSKLEWWIQAHELFKSRAGSAKSCKFADWTESRRTNDQIRETFD